MRGGSAEEGGEARSRPDAELPRAAPLKKGNLDGAKSCYQAVLNRGQQKDAAGHVRCPLLAKSKAPGTDEQKNYIAESMVYAKAAVKLDLTDGTVVPS